MWLLVGAIGFIFIVQFGPQSRGCSSRSGGPTFVAKVYGSAITEDAFRWAWIVSRAASVPRDQSKALRLKEAVINGLIERELLALAAEKMGIKVTEEDVDQYILSGTIFYNASVHSPIRMPSGPIPIDFTKDDGSFDFETFNMFINGQFQMSLSGFKQQQIREILADRMRKIIENSVELYPQEAREEYEKLSNWTKVKSATFDPLQYAKKHKPSPAEIKRWAQNNEEAIKKYYDENEFKYKNVEKQVRIRNILIKVAIDAEEEERVEKQQLAESIYKQAAKGEDFAALAKKHSEDDKTKASGGDNDYNPRGYWEEKLEDVVFGMEPGEIKGPLETEEGFQIVKCEGFREGNIPIQEVRLEIAEQLMVEEKSKKEATADAEKFLAMIEGGEEFDEAVKKIKEEFSTAEGSEEEGSGPSADIPSIRTSGEIRKNSTHIPGVGSSKELITEIFDMDDSINFVDRVVEVNEKFHVIEIEERHHANNAEFLEKKDILERGLLGEKKIALVEHWIDAQRKKAEEQGAIHIEKVYLKYPGEEATDEKED